MSEKWHYWSFPFDERRARAPLRPLEELLGAAARLCPKRFFIGEEGACGAGQVGVRFDSDSWRHMLGDDDGKYGPDDYALIIAAVVEALEARALYWELSRDFDGHFARVQRSSLGHPRYALEVGPAVVPAHALLAAFIAALEAERKQ